MLWALFIFIFGFHLWLEKCYIVTRKTEGLYMDWLLTFLLNALAIVLADRLLDDIRLSGIMPALLAGAALGIVNTFLRPVLMLLTFPLTVFSLGLFIFIINAVTFAVAAWLVPGFDILSFGGAFWGALITGIISWLLNLLFQQRD